jgi:predicted metal-dependent hydrolase
MAALNYTVRPSRRAKHVSLRVLPPGVVEVVIPPGFDPKQVPEIVASRQDWLQKHIDRFSAEAAIRPATGSDGLPTEIELQFCAAEASPTSSPQKQGIWQVTYRNQPNQALRLTVPKSQQIQVAGDLSRPAAVYCALRSWLNLKAQRDLVPQLRQLSRDLHLPVNRISVRGQKTRWGSCSSHGNISLNYKLLFVPAATVHYVMVHELCHTQEMNHSPEFWRLVGQYCPDYNDHRALLKQAWQFIPAWVEAKP